jgi:hypothetical protein
MGHLLFGIAIVIAFIYGAQALYESSVSLPPSSTAPGAVLVALAPPPLNGFTETGTLIFYPNNVGPVPYLMYSNGSGNTVSKALVFEQSPPSDFSTWSGARVQVSGYVDSEHVVVTAIAYVAGP